ncbi:hypothetical protein BDW75DRAFT_245431 [Aspergillus navahoensis]
MMWKYLNPPNDLASAYNIPISDEGPSSPFINWNGLAIEFWERPVETATESLVGLCATGPTLSSTRDEKIVADKEHISGHNVCSHSYNWPSPPDLTTSVRFESSTTSTSPELPPIDPRILRWDKDQPVPMMGTLV